MTERRTKRRRRRRMSVDLCQRSDLTRQKSVH
jgi:hypothetical protein